MHLLVGGPERASIVVLACEDQKKPWTFWYAYMSWPGAQICFRHKWGKLVTASLLLDCIDWYSCLRYWNEFFAAVFQVLNWSFHVFHFDGNVCNWIPKVMWPRMDEFWGFLLKNGVFRWHHICADWNLQKFLSCYYLLTTSIFLRCLVWGVFWSVLEKCLCFSAVGFCNIDW